MTTPINIVIKGTNKLNKLIADSVPGILAELKNHIGKKVTKIDGDFLESIKPSLTKHLPTQERRPIAYFDNSDYSIRLEYKICLSGGSYDDNTYYCKYFDQSVYLGNLKDQVLTEVRDGNLAEFQEKITVAKELKKVEQYKKLKEKANDIFNDIDENVKAHFYLSR